MCRSRSLRGKRRRTTARKVKLVKRVTLKRLPLKLPKLLKPVMLKLTQSKWWKLTRRMMRSPRRTRMKRKRINLRLSK